MKHFIKLLFILLFCGINDVFADINGGYISYRVLPNDSVELTLSLVRSCIGLPFNQNQTVSLKQGSTSQSISLPRVRMTDITALCGPTFSPCSSTNFIYYGFEQNVFSKVVSLAAYSASAPIQIQYAECCIPGSVSNVNLLTSNNLYLEASFFKGYTLNEGPVFRRSLPAVFLVGVPNYYNADIINSNGDSIVYELSAPNYANGSPYTYNSSYTTNKQFQYSGSGAISLSFDPVSRQLSTGSTKYVVPTSQQMALISYTISRYRNGVFIGNTKVAHTILMTANTSSNQTPLLNLNSTSYKVCAGGQLCLSLYSSDANTNDSTYVFMDNTTVSGVNFTSNNQKNATGNFCWSPNANHVRNEPYYFTFRVRDNSCPKTLESFLTISVKVDSVGGVIQANPTAEYNYCSGKVDFAANVQQGPGNYQYQWWGPGGLTALTANHNFNYGSVGWKPFTLRITSPGACNDYVKNDSVFVPQYTPLKVTIFDKSDTISCSNAPFLLQPTVRGGMPPINFYWNNDTTSSNSYTFQSITPDTVYLKAVDAYGCVSYSSIFVRMRQNPVTTIAGDNKTLCKSPLGAELFGSPAGGFWSGSSCVNNFQKLFIPQLSCVGQNQIIYTYTDTYGCIGRDTVVYTVTDKVKSDAGAYTSVCATTGFVQLNGSPAGGTWFGDSVRLNKFYPSQFKVGLNQLIYRSPLSCSEDDTTYLEVLSAPPVSIQVPDSFCSNVAQATLSASPAGGSWFGNHILNDKFNLQTAGAGKHEIAYYYYSPAGCLTSNSKWITVQADPTVSAGTDLTVCKNSGTINLNATPSGGNWSGPLVSSGKFYSDSAFGGTYTNVYQYSSGVCNLRDTMKIHLLEAGFNAAVVSGNAPLMVNFNNTSSTGFDYYSWVFGDPGSGSANISTQTNPSHTYNNQGVYQVKLTAGNTASACTHAVTKNAYIAVGPNGVNNVFLSESFTVFPNPAKEGRVTLLLTHADGSLSSDVQLFDVSGRMLKIYHPVINEPLEIDGLSRGVYFFKAVIADGSVQVKKLIVQ